MFKAAIHIDDEDLRAKFARHAIRTQSEQRLRAMINLAQPERPIAENQLDYDPWLLNVINGTIDLRTGTLRPHQRENYITKLIPIPYDPAASCPTWEAFLERIMDGKPDLISYLKKCVGYSLTGSTQEQVMFILFGSGANGKSTFISTILSLMSEFGMQTPTETLLKSGGGGIRNDVARLKGARFVAAVESDDGKQLAEALVKQLTGGDRITARFLYREHFEFDPSFKLFLAANHKPVIRGSDYAIWRRIRLIPFTVTIRPEQQDKNLVEKLKTELSGILRWAVEGCLSWQKEGLQPPESVKVATDDYRVEMDIISEFIAECCEEKPEAKTSFKVLYDRYATWCAENQDEPIDKRDFGRCLSERGFRKGRNNRERFRTGIGLRVTHE